jgi:DNA-binding HxlR family transcriptional regulator
MGSNKKIEKCPVLAMSRILGRKWTLAIIHNLRQKRRYCELQEKLGNINPTLLAQRLRSLERAGIVERIENPDNPRHVEYMLTPKGKELLPILDQLADWARRWDIVKNSSNKGK